MVIGDCGCWIIRSYQGGKILRFMSCGKHVDEALDSLRKRLHIDRVGSVSAVTETEAQLWLT